MRVRRLPAVARIEGLAKEDPLAAQAYVRDILGPLYASEGFQLILQLLAQIEHADLERLRVSRKTDVDWLTGRLSAIRDVREGLRALLPDTAEVPEPEEEEEFDLYPEEVPHFHSFAIPSGE